MSRIVRFEEIDGELVLRVPADIAARLNLAVGDDVLLTDGEKCMTVERLDPRDQLTIGREVAARHREALGRLAR